jgi:hypothetical protein
MRYFIESVPLHGSWPPVSHPSVSMPYVHLVVDGELPHGVPPVLAAYFELEQAHKHLDSLKVVV